MNRHSSSSCTRLESSKDTSHLHGATGAGNEGKEACGSGQDSTQG